MSSTIKVILFDLGGVLVKLGASPVPSVWLDGNAAFTAADWFSSETAIAFEKGLISADVFAVKFKKDLNISASCEQIIQHFSRWPIGLYPGTQDLLQDLNPHYSLAVLSNTNELHWPRMLEEFELPRYIEHLFASHLLNQAKPELSIFQHVINELNVEAKNILFFDDNVRNIEASKQLGIQGIHVEGLEQARQQLLMLGLINA